MKTFLTRDQFTQYYTATGGETQITLTRTVCRTNTDFAVFRNGLFQTPGSTADYVFIDRYGIQASNTEAFVSAIKFNTVLSLNDKVSIVSGVISGTNLTDIYNYIGDTGVSTNLTTPYNLNNLIHGGRYFLAYNAGNTNCPVSVDCHIQVIQKDINSLVQILYPTNGDSPVWRRYTDSVWSTWNQFVLNKANVSMDNLTHVGTTAIAHCAMPSSRYIAVSLPAHAGSTTAPADGYFDLSGTAITVNANIAMTANITSAMWSNVANQTLYAWIPVKKGDIVSVYYSNMSSATLFFRYAEGAY